MAGIPLGKRIDGGDIERANRVLAGPVGTWCWRSEDFYVHLPEPGGFTHIKIGPDEPGKGPRWQIIEKDGKISITPSIRVTTSRPKRDGSDAVEIVELWHGFITNGEMVVAG